MRQDELKPPIGTKRARKRVGRGDGSGHGSFSGRGMKGQNSRSGGGVRPGFEGGQLPLIKSLPSHRGFTNIFREEYTVVNIDRLAGFAAGSDINVGSLVEAGAIKGLKSRVKILGRGELDRALTVEAHRFSKTAREKIEAAGGVAREIG